MPDLETRFTTEDLQVLAKSPSVSCYIDHEQRLCIAASSHPDEDLMPYGRVCDLAQALLREREERGRVNVLLADAIEDDPSRHHHGDLWHQAASALIQPRDYDAVPITHHPGGEDA